MDTTALRRRVYERLFDDAEVPALAELAETFGTTADAVRTAIRDAKLGKTLVPDPVTGEIWMAGPFAARPTPYRVRAGGRAWWANCAWDMLGVANLVARPEAPALLDAACTDCGAPMPMRVEAGAAHVDGAPPDAVIHFVVPARRWYDDIGFT